MLTSCIQGDLGKSTGGPKYPRAEVGCRLRRFPFEIILPDVDQPVEWSTSQSVPIHRTSEFENHGMIAGSADLDPVERLAPPFRPDAAKHRLADDLRDLGSLDIERGEGDERSAQWLGSECSDQEAVWIVSSYKSGAVDCMVVDGRIAPSTRNASDT